MTLRTRIRRPFRRALILAAVGATLTLAAAPVPAAATGTVTDLLDIVPVNADAEAAGGLDPRLPTESAALDAALDAARGAGLPPDRYAALLHQYWLARGAEASGIDLAAWDPNAGFAANATLVNRVYANYGRYQLARPELNWAGMAGMAGASFAAGFWDLDTGRTILTVDLVQQIGRAVGTALAALPAGTAAALPDDVRTLAAVGPTLTADDLEWYQRRLLVMQKHIYFDMVPMHEAYLSEGPAAVDEMRRAGLFDDNTVAAWDAIAAGTDAGRAEAVVRMADREQNTIVADQWDETAGARDGAGRALAYVTTIAAQPSVPGTVAPGVFAPLTVHVSGPDGSPVLIQAPLPDFNWADRGPRWRYIADDTAPAYQRLVEQRPGKVDALLEQPFPEFADRQRVVARAPALVRDLTSGWSVAREP